VWVNSKDFAIVEKVVAKHRGELGTSRLSPAFRVSGRVLSGGRETIPKTVRDY